ncbi:hypothetical protein HYFRA_00013750 [Hymenoscyphus fraxineus]|uniref:Uncharacterized protein n=1 Tax=Hymenoscyphus fraxineus TaxID=746836 RepID=A0A9N9Q007_9HELO|nr:hypothetical protein HYFRA_00013750 [Hymenoscyphus fraxineus]
MRLTLIPLFVAALAVGVNAVGEGESCTQNSQCTCDNGKRPVCEVTYVFGGSSAVCVCEDW